MNNENFFSKYYIFTAIWTLLMGIILAVLVFFSGYVWKKVFGPDEIVVIRKDNFKDTTISLIQFVPEQQYFDKVSLAASKTISTSIINNNLSRKKIDSLSLSIFKTYKSNFDSLKSTLAKIDELKYKLPSSLKGSTSVLIVQRPKFEVPKIVEGYTQGKINSLANLTINKLDFNTKENIIINLDFFGSQGFNNLTPIYVDLVEPKTANSVYHIWGEQYRINGIENTIVVNSDFKPGKYKLSVGFYKLDEINAKYPIFYSKEFEISIK